MLARLLPKPTVSRDDATHTAWEHGWTYHDMFLPEGEQPFEKVWLTEDGSTSVHWIEDKVIDLNYLAVKGARRDEVLQALREDLDTYDRAAVREMVEAADDWDELIVALNHVAASAPPQFDPEVFGWFERGFAHEHPTVRRMTAILTAYPGWAELRAPLERLLGDEDAETRAVAEKMLRQVAGT